MFTVYNVFISVCCASLNSLVAEGKLGKIRGNGVTSVDCAKSVRSELKTMNPRLCIFTVNLKVRALAGEVGRSCRQVGPTHNALFRCALQKKKKNIA